MPRGKSKSCNNCQHLYGFDKNGYAICRKEYILGGPIIVTERKKNCKCFAEKRECNDGYRNRLRERPGRVNIY